MKDYLSEMVAHKIGVIPLPGGTWGARSQCGKKGYGDTPEAAIDQVLEALGK